jgi:hypothetical protein
MKNKPASAAKPAPAQAQPAAGTTAAPAAPAPATAAPATAAPAPATAAPAAKTVAQEFQASPVAAGINTAAGMMDVPAQIQGVQSLANKAAGKAAPAAAGKLGSKLLGGAALAIEPAMMAYNYSKDPKAFKQNLQSKNQRDIDLVDQGKYGQMAAQTAYDAAVNPVETIARSGVKAAETGSSIWDAAKSYFGAKQGSALTPKAQQKAKAAGMLADNFNALIDYLHHSMHK